MNEETLDKLKKEDNAGYWDYLFSPISSFSQDNTKTKYSSIRKVFNIEPKQVCNKV